MGTVRDDELTIRSHRPGLTEKLFFFISGILTSIPLTLFVSTLTDQLCVVLYCVDYILCLVMFNCYLSAFRRRMCKSLPSFLSPR